MTKRFGFTLAEVLITLGIIGVVAAMTIPTLIANTNGTKYRSQFKKTLSTLNQAGLMAQAQYDLDYAGTSVACAATQTAAAAEHPESTFTFCALLNGTLTGQTYYAAASDITRNTNSTSEAYAIKSRSVLPTDAESYHAYTLADGSIVAFDADAKGCTLPIGTQLTSTVLAGDLKDCLGFIDVNGATLPNKEVTCSTGTTGNTVETPCTVKNDASHMTDIFPIVFHDATVEPASNAAKYILTSAK
jgi:prepilin-type N-terminal cleavage/methylation domain-containing protein